jgi:hypothetical protein
VWVRARAATLLATICIVTATAPLKVRVVARISERTGGGGSSGGSSGGGGAEAKVKKTTCRIVTSDDQTVSGAAVPRPSAFFGGFCVRARTYRVGR